jgi:hypothetical protein
MAMEMLTPLVRRVAEIIKIGMIVMLQGAGGLGVGVEANSSAEPIRAGSADLRKVLVRARVRSGMTVQRSLEACRWALKWLIRPIPQEMTQAMAGVLTVK